MNVRIEDVGGRPAVTVDGQPLPPVSMTVSNFRNEQPVNKDYYRRLGEAGIHVFFLIGNIDSGLGYTRTILRDMADILSVVPDAKFFVRIGVYMPPEWFADGEVGTVRFHSGRQYPTEQHFEAFTYAVPGMRAMYARKWREDAGRLLDRLVREHMASPFADRILGYFICGGGTSEWYYEHCIDMPDDYADTSDEFAALFRTHLRETYATDAALQAAWGDRSVTLDTATVPDERYRSYSYLSDDVNDTARIGSADERHPFGTLMPPECRRGYDFFSAWHNGVADTIRHFASVVKAVDSRLLTGAFYGYYGWTYPFWSGNTTGAIRLLDSGAIDFLSAPGVYDNREPGGWTGQRIVAESLQARNRLFFVENDIRTYLDDAVQRNTHGQHTVRQSVGVLKREFGRLITGGNYSWWFDQTRGGGRYDSPAILKLFAQQSRIAAESMQKDRSSNAEIAVVYSQQSVHALSSKTSRQIVELNTSYELGSIGAPYDSIYAEDIGCRVRPYKLYLFLNASALHTQTRTRIVETLQNQQATAIWLYAPGFIDLTANTLSDDNARALTGIRLRMDPVCSSVKFTVSDELPALAGRTIGIHDRPMRNNVSGRMRRIHTRVNPLVYADDAGAVALGFYDADGRTAAAVKDYDGMRSVFYGGLALDPAFVRHFARKAGCTIYIDSDDVVYGNHAYLVLHAAQDGDKRLYVGQTVREAYSRRLYRPDADGYITLPMRKGQTHMFVY